MKITHSTLLPVVAVVKMNHHLPNELGQILMVVRGSYNAAMDGSNSRINRIIMEVVMLAMAARQTALMVVAVVVHRTIPMVTLAAHQIVHRQNQHFVKDQYCRRCYAMV